MNDTDQLSPAQPSSETAEEVFIEILKRVTPRSSREEVKDFALRRFLVVDGVK